MKVYSLVGIVIISVVVYFFLGSNYQIKNSKSDGKDIIAFGDSLVAGVGSEGGGGFVKMLSDDLRVTIVNLGVSGNTTRDGLERIGILDNYDPRIVLVLLGGNDFLRKVPEEEIFSNLEKIILNIQSNGSAVILLGVRSGVLSNRYDGAFEDLAEKLGAAYVPDVLNDVFGVQELMYDTLHPNDAGYRIIANKVKPALEKIINE
ncbi:MAG: GDSL-type esterase/lipase family protein [Minisyncoccota bacterium]